MERTPSSVSLRTQGREEGGRSRVRVAGVNGQHAPRFAWSARRAESVCGKRDGARSAGWEESERPSCVRLQAERAGTERGCVEQRGWAIEIERWRTARQHPIIVLM